MPPKGYCKLTTAIKRLTDTCPKFTVWLGASIGRTKKAICKNCANYRVAEGK